MARPRIIDFLNHRRLILFWAVAALALTGPWLVPAGSWSPTEGRVMENCRVMSIYDGDTMTVRCAGRKVKVRLYCIDAPEMGQKPWGKQSRDHLRSITSKRVRVEVRDTDRYGRTVGEVFAAKRSLNLRQVRSGWAAEYGQYCDSRRYRIAEAGAQQERIGIWSTPGLHQSPWEWRSSK